ALVDAGVEAGLLGVDDGDDAGGVDQVLAVLPVEGGVAGGLALHGDDDGVVADRHGELDVVVHERLEVGAAGDAGAGGVVVHGGGDEGEAAGVEQAVGAVLAVLDANVGGHRVLLGR